MVDSYSHSVFWRSRNKLSILRRVTELAANRGLVVGMRNSLTSTLLMAALTSLILPGFGVVILPSMFLDGDFQLGALAWVVVWALPAFAARSVQREHRLSGNDLVSTYHSGEVTRQLRDVVAVRAAPLFLPAAAVQFSDGATVWAYGPTTEPFMSHVLQKAAVADDRLPSGKWLRPRRMVWFVLVVLLAASDASR